MSNKIILIISCYFLFLTTPHLIFAENPQHIDLQKEMLELKKSMEEQKKEYEAKLNSMQKKLDELSKKQEYIDKTDKYIDNKKSEKDYSGLKSAVQSMNPDISAIIDTYYHNNDAKGGISDLHNSIAGFAHSHGGGEHSHEHQHSHLEEGFNMRHLEIMLSADVDPYFKAWAIAAISEEGAEMEEAVIQTSSLPLGLQIKAGKFFSDFGRINPQHSHEWDFTDQPLIYKTTLGEHGLNEKGIGVSWLAPTPFYLLAGIEAFQGENEMIFNHLAEEPLPSWDGPRLWTGWLKFGPELPAPNALQFGLSAGRGKHQEEHDGNGDGDNDHWFDGTSTFYGADFVYKYDSTKPYGQGDFVFQGEYFRRKKDLELIDHLFKPEFVGNSLKETQDGYYIQGIYGFLPRYRAGLRFEQIGLVNDKKYPSGLQENFDGSWRLSGMTDYSPTEFSRIRLQLNRGEYETLENKKEDAWEVFLQLMISLGAHGAHKF